MSFLCLFGKGTKASKYLINHDKEYIAKLRLGIKTDTGDREGKIIEERKVNPDSLERPKIESSLKNFIGKIQQKPPAYSAIKVNRKKAL